MDAEAGHLATPVLGLLAAVVEIAEAAALEEALAHVLHTALDVRLVLRPTHAGGVDEEATALAVLEEGAGRPWLERVGSSDRCREVVEDDPHRDTTEEGPGSLQPGDALLQRLSHERPDEAVPAVGQDRDQRPGGLLLTSRRINDGAQPAEVEFDNLARRPVRHPHRRWRPLPEPRLAHVAAQPV